MGVSRFDEKTPDQLKKIVDDGTASFKIFLAYKGAFGVDDDELYRTLEFAKRLGVIVTAHCENAEVVSQLQQKLIAEGKTGPEWHEPSRPTTVEAEGVHHLATFAELTGAHVYVVHTSNEDALRVAQGAQNRGVRMWVETVIPYLVLDKTYAEKPNFEGAKYVMSPPLREKRHQDALWNALQTGLVSTVATDHAPFDFKGQKEMGARDFTQNSQRHSQRRRPREFAVHLRRLQRPDRSAPLRGCRQHAGRALVRSVPAQRHDSARQRRRPGDLRPAYRGKISGKTQQMNVDYSGFEGVANRRPPQRRHAARQSAGPRRQVRGRRHPWQVFTTNPHAWVSRASTKFAAVRSRSRAVFELGNGAVGDGRCALALELIAEAAAATTPEAKRLARCRLRGGQLHAETAPAHAEFGCHTDRSQPADVEKG